MLPRVRTSTGGPTKTTLTAALAAASGKTTKPDVLAGTTSGVFPRIKVGFGKYWIGQQPTLEFSPDTNLK